MVSRTIRVLVACATVASSGLIATVPAAASTPVCGTNSAELVAAARAEGSLRLVAVPDTWANYGELRKRFTARYGIRTSVLEPDASSARELEIFTEMKGKPGRPDVYDLGMAYLPIAVSQGVLARYTPATWGSVPKQFRDPERHWVGNYFGLVGFGTNVTLQPKAPTSWADLLDPVYRGQVYINGDPRQSSTALATVAAASLANGGTLNDINPGIEYFSRLKSNGNLAGSPVTRANVVAGRIPVGLNWNFTWPLLQPEARANGYEVRAGVPTDGLVAGFYGQGVSADAEHPCAARMWATWLSSDTGQRLLLASGAVPARYSSLTLTPAQKRRLPSKALLARAETPNAAQLSTMLAAVRSEWGSSVVDAPTR
jgi:putative spermidine/putrescine transport system substrate-binding protein